MDYKNTNEGISVLHRIDMKNESQQQSHHVTQNLNTYPCTMYIPSSIYINWDTQGQIQTTAQIRLTYNCAHLRSTKESLTI